MKIQPLQLFCRIAAVILLATSYAAAQAPQIELELDKFIPEHSRVLIQKLENLQGVKPSSHWMGVVVQPTEPLLRKHLRIDGGLVVQAVTKGSPAAAADIEKDDILLTCNDTAVADLKGLMEFLTENQDKELTVKLLREGKKQSVSVTPTERPEGHAQFFPPPDFQFELPDAARTPELWRKWMNEKMKQGQAFEWKGDGEQPFKLRFFHPGVVLGEDVDVDVDIGNLPEGLTVIVTKAGDKPAQIKVKRGDEAWEVSEQELDKLPEDIREHVKKYIAKGRMGIRVDGLKILRPAVEAQRALRILPAPKAQQGRIRVEARAVDDGVEKKLDEINGRLERIEKAIQKLTQE